MSQADYNDPFEQVGGVPVFDWNAAAARRHPVSIVTLTDFLLARIAEDEWHARPFVNDLGQTRPWVAAEVGGRVDSGPNPLGGDGEIATATTHMAAVHIARHDPARVLAECEAKRRIVALEEQDALGDVGRAIYGTQGSRVLRLLALPYADHPDYREEWKP